MTTDQMLNAINDKIRGLEIIIAISFVCVIMAIAASSYANKTSLYFNDTEIEYTGKHNIIKLCDINKTVTD